MRSTSSAGLVRYEDVRLRFAKRKPRRPGFSLLYRVVAVLAGWLGPRRVLGPVLDLAWCLQRIGYEQAGSLFGHDFHDRACGVAGVTLDEVVRPDDRVLDVGSGIGRMLVKLGPRASSVVGVEHDVASADVARQRCAEMQNVDVVVDDAYRYIDALPDRSFDLTLLIHIVEHVGEPEQLLKRLTRVTDRIFVEVPDVEADPLNLARLSLNRRFYSDDDHTAEYTERAARELLAATGWDVRRIWRRGGAITLLGERTPAGPR